MALPFEILDCRYHPHLETALAQNLHKYHFSYYEDPEKFAEKAYRQVQTADI